MTLDLGIEPGPHWWEASALTTAPSLHPMRTFKTAFRAVSTHEFTIASDLSIFNNFNLVYEVSYVLHFKLKKELITLFEFDH